jgi:hypothetical protein
VGRPGGPRSPGTGYPRGRPPEPGRQRHRLGFGGGAGGRPRRGRRPGGGRVRGQRPVARPDGKAPGLRGRGAPAPDPGLPAPGPLPLPVGTGRPPQGPGRRTAAHRRTLRPPLGRGRLEPVRPLLERRRPHPPERRRSPGHRRRGAGRPGLRPRSSVPGPRRPPVTEGPALLVGLAVRPGPGGRRPGAPVAPGMDHRQRRPPRVGPPRRRSFGVAHVGRRRRTGADHPGQGRRRPLLRKRRLPEPRGPGRRRRVGHPGWATRIAQGLPGLGVPLGGSGPHRRPHPDHPDEGRRKRERAADPRGGRGRSRNLGRGASSRHPRGGPGGVGRRRPRHPSPDLDGTVRPSRRPGSAGS